MSNLLKEHLWMRQLLLFVIIHLVFGLSHDSQNVVQPFRLDISEKELEDLKIRLERVRWPDNSPYEGWKAGSNVEYMKELVTYWKDTYLPQWKKTHEKNLNSMTQFTTEIDGLRIHFVHVRSKYEDATPLLFSHGWPGSFFECSKILPLLTDPEAFGGTKEDAFHVICPSIPGYGFSEAPKEEGFEATKVARIFSKLMQKLGYDRYVAQGGDWGSLISLKVANEDPLHCIGVHVNMFFMEGGTWRTIVKLLIPSFIMDNTQEWKLVHSLIHYITKEGGYFLIQGTKPNTVGLGLSDSPVGLASYIVEKFHGWSDCNGTIENSFSKDELLTNIMIYWLSNSISSSVRLYYEFYNGDRGGVSISQPFGFAKFQDLVHPPSADSMKNLVNLVQYTEMPSGGHFAALEEPELLVQDIRSFVRKIPNVRSRDEL